MWQWLRKSCDNLKSHLVLIKWLTKVLFDMKTVEVFCATSTVLSPPLASWTNNSEPIKKKKTIYEILWNTVHNLHNEEKLCKVPFNWKARGYWPKSHMYLIGLNFRGFFLVVFGCSFLNSALLFWFLSKSYDFLTSNLKLFFWTGQLVTSIHRRKRVVNTGI